MRSEKELLQILLNNINYLDTGLCKLSQFLFAIDKINWREFNFIIDLLYENITDYYYACNPNRYFFKPGLKQPRIKYLKELIEKYS